MINLDIMGNCGQSDAMTVKSLGPVGTDLIIVTLTAFFMVR